MNITTLLPKLLKWTELVALVVTLLGIAFKTMHWTGANNLVLFGLTALAGIYFLSAFAVIPLPEQANGELKGFADMLVLILRKLMFIGLAVFCIAFLFSILHFPGAGEMMLIGLGAVVIGSLASMILVFGKRERMPFLIGPLSRCLAAVLLYFVLPFLR